MGPRQRLTEPRSRGQRQERPQLGRRCLERCAAGATVARVALGRTRVSRCAPEGRCGSRGVARADQRECPRRGRRLAAPLTSDACSQCFARRRPLRPLCPLWMSGNSSRTRSSCSTCGACSSCSQSCSSACAAPKRAPSPSRSALAARSPTPSGRPTATCRLGRAQRGAASIGSNPPPGTITFNAAYSLFLDPDSALPHITDTLPIRRITDRCEVPGSGQT